MANLQDIAIKVRRLTRSPSLAQLTDTELYDYINTFILYDFPEHLRLFDYRTTLSWTCNPNQDTYLTDTSIPTSSPLYDFKNRYITTDAPIYIDGYKTYYSQNRDQFFAQFPFVNFLFTIAHGNGTPGPFTGTLTNVPLNQNTLMFAATDINGKALVLQDYPITTSNVFGNLRTPGSAINWGTIDYLTGDYNFTFPANVPADNEVTAHYYSYVASRPIAMLYTTQTVRNSNAPFGEISTPQFILRPVPDRAYTIVMEVMKRPTALMEQSAIPELEQYWQYIAYGAAKKVFEDRMDLDSVAQIMPEFKKQEALVLRRTLVQQLNQRSATIYSQNVSMSATWPGNGWNGIF